MIILEVRCRLGVNVWGYPKAIRRAYAPAFARRMVSEYGMPLSGVYFDYVLVYFLNNELPGITLFFVSLFRFIPLHQAANCKTAFLQFRTLISIIKVLSWVCSQYTNYFNYRSVCVDLTFLYTGIILILHIISNITCNI